MLTPVTCPNCGANYTTDVHQVIDAGRNPDLKQRLMSGQLNVGVCPTCGTAVQIAGPMIYHEAAHDLFMIYVPQELNLDQVQREQMIGQMTRQVIDNLPAEQKRAYLLQPKTVLTMQGFLENVLATEGITPDMLDRQRKQVELLDTLASADADVVDFLLKERAREIDEGFFALLRAQIEAAGQANDNTQLIPLINLQARLMTGTEIGRKLEKRQAVLHQFNLDMREAGGLSPAILLRHILRNQEDPEAVQALARVGGAALTYEFFSGLTAEIDKQEIAGKQANVARLKQIRSELLKLQEEMQRQSDSLVAAAQAELAKFLSSSDPEKAIQANLNKIDDVFMYVLDSEVKRAEQGGDEDRLKALKNIENVITSQAQGQAPPEIQLLNALIMTDDRTEQEQLLDENQSLLSPDLVKIVDLLQDELRSTGQRETMERLGALKGMIAARVEMAAT